MYVSRKLFKENALIRLSLCKLVMYLQLQALNRFRVYIILCIRMYVPPLSYVEYSYVTYESIIHMQRNTKYICYSTYMHMHVRRFMHAYLSSRSQCPKANFPETFFSLLFLVSPHLFHLPPLAPHTYHTYIHDMFLNPFAR